MALDTHRPKNYRRSWNGGQKPDVSELMQLLGEVYETEAERDLWLNSPHQLLGDRIPILMVAEPEGYAEVVRVLRCLLDGAYV